MAAILTTGDALLADILNYPADDSLRLILADLLEEQDTEESLARSEFIRVQMEIVRTNARLSDGCELMPDNTCSGRNAVLWAIANGRNREKWCSSCGPKHRLLQREDRIFRPESGIREWFGDRYRLCINPDALDGNAPVALIRRGFIAEVHLPLAEWLTHGPALAQRHPIETVEILDREPEWNPNDNRYYWGQDGGGFPLTGSRWISEALWLFLSGTDFSQNHQPRNHGYVLIADAKSDLSQACIDWARSVDLTP